jgi:hypothetical protein
MRAIDVWEYEHFVSFILEDDADSCFHVQYRMDQVWRDENDVWQIIEKQQPFHVSPVAAMARPRKVRLSPTMLTVIEKALKRGCCGQQ